MGAGFENIQRDRQQRVIALVLDPNILEGEEALMPLERQLEDFLLLISMKRATASSGTYLSKL